jgi:CBS domain-containing protein
MFFITRKGGLPEPYHRIEAADESHNEGEEREGEGEEREQSDKRADALAGVVAKEVMTSFKAVREGESIDRAWESIKRSNFESLPVISKEGKLLGMLNSNDAYKARHNNKEVGEVMADTVCASSDTTVEEMAQLFFDKRVKVLPIIDRESKVVGVVTPGDLLRTIVKLDSIEKPL